jgi:hypothetical protein
MLAGSKIFERTFNFNVATGHAGAEGGAECNIAAVQTEADKRDITLVRRARHRPASKTAAAASSASMPG